jgi:glycosyltransferase involved in cell wall biosynthesis
VTGKRLVVGWKAKLVNPSSNGAQESNFDAELVQLENSVGNDVVVDLTGAEPHITARPHLSVVQPPRVSVVVPTLNEAKNLPHVFKLLAEQDIHEVLLVDGFSTDDTIQVAQALRPDVKVVHQTRRGKGNALKHGFAAATGDIIVMLDADGSADPGEIPAYVEALVNGADFAKGTRFARGGGSTDITPLRRAGNFGLNTLTNVLYRSKFTDLCYGYNAFWKHCLPHMNVDCDGFEVETLINVRIHKAGLKIAEVGSFEADRIHGTSNLNTFRDGWRVLKTIFKERVRRTPAVATSTAQVEEAPAA